MTLLDRWEAAATPQGGDSAVWRDMMRIQLEQARPAALDRLLAVGAGAKQQSLGEYYKTFINTLGTDIQARLDIQKQQATKALQSAGDEQQRSETRSPMASELVTTGKPSAITPKTLGSSTNDQVFTPITPCRVVDTRNLGGAIGPFATRNFFYFTTSTSTNWNSIQGGVNGAAGTVCPGTVVTGFNPSSAVATITVTGQGGNGNLIVWQGTNPVASASTMSYPASGDASSLAVIPWGGRSGAGPGGTVEDFGVFVNAFTATNVVVDIVGYYGAPAATPLECVVTAITSTALAANALGSLSAPACPAGYTLATLSCGLSGSGWVNYVDPTVCWGHALATAADTLNVRSHCCRVPGH